MLRQHGNYEHKKISDGRNEEYTPERYAENDHLNNRYRPVAKTSVVEPACKDKLQAKPETENTGI